MLHLHTNDHKQVRNVCSNGQRHAGPAVLSLCNKLHSKHRACAYVQSDRHGVLPELEQAHTSLCGSASSMTCSTASTTDVNTGACTHLANMLSFSDVVHAVWSEASIERLQSRNVCKDV